MSALVVGIGNRSRGDDAVGPEVAEHVAALGVPGVEVVVHDEPLALVEHLGLHDEVVVVDAVGPHGEPGRVHVVHVGSAPLRGDSPVLGSHGLGVAEAVELARTLDRLPRRLTIVGVEGASFDLGAPMSEQVRTRVDEAARIVVGVLSAVAP